MKNVQYFETVPVVINELSEIVAEGDILLVKGSRGMHMEQVVEALLHMVPVFKV
jgi:UDP-N-acetylmuramoyl-tripeptide--D-alanyl-D-alanine ligase